eukprot:gene8847-18329_t
MCDIRDIVIGQKYSIIVGKSLSGPETQDKGSFASFATLQYAFKPASVDTSLPGSLKISKNGESTLWLQSSNKSDEMKSESELLLKGSSMASGGNEFALILDKGQQIRLEKISCLVAGLKHERGEDIALDQKHLSSKSSSQLPTSLRKNVPKKRKKTSSSAVVKGVECSQSSTADSEQLNIPSPGCP